MEDDEVKMIDARQLANLLRVSTRTVTRLAKKGELPDHVQAVKVGHQWRFKVQQSLIGGSK